MEKHRDVQGGIAGRGLERTVALWEEIVTAA
jgi:hypothetical protein